MRIMSITDYVETYKDELSLYEGLIMTYPITDSINILRKAFSKFYYRKGQNDFSIETREPLAKLDLDKLEHKLDVLGWFIAAVSIIDKTGNERRFKFSDKSFIDLDNKIANFYVEAKYDLELRKDMFPKFLFHITTKKNYQKILKRGGLAPKQESKLANHPERVYVAFDKNDAVRQLFPKLKESHPNEHWLIITIDIRGFYAPLRLFRDPNYNGGYFTINHIPKSKFVEVEVIE